MPCSLTVSRSLVVNLGPQQGDGGGDFLDCLIRNIRTRRGDIC